MPDEPQDRSTKPDPGDGQSETRRPDGQGNAGRPPDDGPQRPDGGKPGDPPRGDRPHDDRPPGKRPYGSRPDGGKPGDPPRGDRPHDDRPRGGRPYGSRPGGPPRGDRPYGSRPGGPPRGDRAYGDRPPGKRPYGSRPGGPPRGDRPHDGPPRHERRVDYSHRDRARGPRPPRGPWDRDRGPRGPRGDWGRPDRPGPRPPTGPAPAEMLGEGEEVVAGRRPVEEAFAARREAKRLLVVPERRAALDQLVLHATTLRIPVVEVEGGTITAVSGFDGHQGVALVVAPRRWATLDEVLALAKSRHEPPFLLALDHLEDPQNVGTLLRSAEACGVHGVIFPTRGAAPISPAAIKTSAGAVEHLLLVPMPDLAAGLVDLHARGVRVIGADGDASMTVREADMRGPVVIVTGSEGRGLNAKVRRRVDLMARIPMRGKVASLNASVAGSVFLFEAAAQRDLPEAEHAPEVTLTEPESQSEAGPAASSESGPDVVMTSEAGAEAAQSSEAEPESVVSSDPDDLLPEVPPATAPDAST